MSIFSLFAQDKIDAESIGVPITSPDVALGTILGTVYAWAGIICVLIIIIAGYFYVVSGGNASNTKRAREAIIGAVVGIIIILMAFVITQFVIGRF